MTLEPRTSTSILENNQVFAEKINELLANPDLNVDQRTKLLGKLMALSNATARAATSEKWKHRQQGKGSTAPAVTARFS